MEEIIKNVKENISYFISENDSYEVMINKIIKKLKENNVTLEVGDYDILEFGENFSKVNFKIKIQNLENTKEESINLILPNNSFYDSLIKCFKKIIELYIVKTFKIEKSLNSEKEGITDKQRSFIEDKIESNPQLIEKELDKMQVSSIKELSKAQASQIITSLQRNRHYR